LHRVRLLLFALLTGLTAANARAGLVVLDFEDSVGVISLVPSPYGGIDWLGNWYSYTLPQDPYNAHSGVARLLTFGTGAAETLFDFQTPVLFDGAWIAGQGVEAPGVNFNLYLGGSLVGTSSTLIQSATPTFLASGYAGLVDRVGFYGELGRYVMDDVTYRTAPEPSAAVPLLVAIGLGLRHARRRGRTVMRIS
jgi:hypothetical protein